MARKDIASIERLIGTNRQSGDALPLDVTLLDTNGSPAAIGGGTQYTDLDVDSSPTGTVLIAMDGSTARAVLGSTSSAPSSGFGIWTRPIVQGTPWAVNHAPAAAAKATITKSSVAGSLICKGFSVVLAASTTAPVATQLTVALISGAAGGSTYLWGPVPIAIPASACAMAAFVFGSRWDVGTAGDALTLEFNSSGPANTIEAVSMNGTTSS